MSVSCEEEEKKLLKTRRKFAELSRLVCECVCVRIMEKLTLKTFTSRQINNRSDLIKFESLTTTEAKFKELQAIQVVS